LVASWVSAFETRPGLFEEIQAFSRKNPSHLQGRPLALRYKSGDTITRPGKQTPWIVMTRILCLSAVVVIGLVATPAALAQPAPKTEKITVQVRPGATTAYLGLVDGKKPAAAVVLLAGGDGVLDLGPAGSIGTDLRLNFLIRSRELFARQGLYPAVLDAPSDREEGMNGAYRLSLQRAGEIGQVIAHLKSRLGVPVWLVGTSSSSLSIVNAAARLPLADLPRPDGVVTTSSMTEPTPYCRKTVFEAQLSAIRVPVLVVSHRDDSCKCSSRLRGLGQQVHCRADRSLREGTQGFHKWPVARVRPLPRARAARLLRGAGSELDRRLDQGPLRSRYRSGCLMPNAAIRIA
jgi:hypothetical protein